MSIKHLAFTICSLAFFLLPLSLQALYNGNPDFPLMPEEGFWISDNCPFGVKAGYEWDDVFNRYLELQKEKEEVSIPVQKFTMLGNFGVVTLGFRDRVEAYGSFGEMQFKMNQTAFNGDILSYETKAQFAWSVGGRALIAYLKGFRFLLDAKYFEAHPQVSSLTFGRTSFSTKGMSLLYEEWQVGGSVSYCWKWFSPYVGIKHSGISATFSKVNIPVELLPKKKIAMKGRYDLGVFTGLGIILKRGFNMNMEWRFVDEYAVTVSADIRF